MKETENILVLEVVILMITFATLFLQLLYNKTNLIRFTDLVKKKENTDEDIEMNKNVN